MSDIKLFVLSNGKANEILGSAASLEKSLQTTIERNLETMLGIRFLASEYNTGPKHGGRVDSLGIDENGCPVIIEYKRATNENVINQGLFYLNWLLDHQAEFKILVMEKFGKETAEEIDWSAPRLLCIAGDFTRYDEHAVQQMNRDIELIRYRKFGDGLLLFELVNATTAQEPVGKGGRSVTSTSAYKTISDTLADLHGPLRDLFEEIRAFLLALGDDVQAKVLKYYIAFKRIKNFASLEIHPAKGCLTVFVKLDPDKIFLESGFTRDVRKVGHYGTGDLEITIHSREDLEKAKTLFIKSYEIS